MNSFTIKDLANLTGIKAHTLRIWEQRYNFLKPSRTYTNIRYYSNDELKIILNIALLNKYGFKISHIDKMTNQEVREKILSLNQLEAQQDRIVHELIQNMADLDMEAFEQSLNQYISTKGIERAITRIIFPFLEKVGILWVTKPYQSRTGTSCEQYYQAKTYLRYRICSNPAQVREDDPAFFTRG
jgi:DNA-binding transcriptional MerR regulator